MSSIDIPTESKVTISVIGARKDKRFQVQVRFLSSLAHAFGATTMLVDLPLGCTVYDLACKLQSSLELGAPRLIVGQQGDIRALFSINGRLVHGDYVIQRKESIMIHPPLAGG